MIKAILESKILQRLIYRRDLFRNISFLGSGALISQMILLLSSPILTRMYAPQEMGVAAIYVSVLGIVSPVISFAYSNAIIVAENAWDAVDLVIISVGILVMMLAASSLLFLFVTPDSYARFGINDGRLILSLIIVGTLLSGLVVCFRQIALRQRNFSMIFFLMISDTTISVAIKLSAGFAAPNHISLIAGTVLGLAIQLAIFLKGCGRKGVETFFKLSKGCSRRLFPVLRKFSDFPSFRLPQLFLFAAAQGMPVIVVGYFFDAGQAGQFALARAVVTLPCALLLTTLGPVFLQDFAERIRNDREIFSTVLWGTVTTFVVASVPYVILILVAPSIFGLLFGVDWIVAGSLARLLAVLYWATAGAVVAAQAFTALRLQGRFLRFELFTSLLKFLGLGVGLAFDSLLLSAGLFAAFGAIGTMAFVSCAVLSIRQSGA